MLMTIKQEGQSGKKSEAKDVLTDEEVQKLMAASGGGALGSRMRCIMAFMWLSGLRISEVLSLKPSDLLWNTNQVRVRVSKYGSGGNPPMPNALRPYIDAWLAHRSRVKLPKDSPLFCVLSKNPGKSIHPKAIWLRMKNLGEKVLPGKKVHPHLFRRTCATRNLRRGYDITEVATLLRHKSTASTHKYLTLAKAQILADKMKDEDKEIFSEN